MSPGGVRRRVHLPAPPASVWEALTRPEDLAAWFGAAVDIEPQRGGSVAVRWPDGTRARGVVEEADPPRRLTFRWRRIAGAGFTMEVGPAARVSFDLEPSEGGTVLTVEEDRVELLAAPGGPTRGGGVG